MNERAKKIIICLMAVLFLVPFIPPVLGDGMP